MFRELLCLSTLLALGTSVHALALQKTPGPTPQSPDAPNFRALQIELYKNRFIWTSKVRNASYQMTITRQCFCMVEYLGPFTLTVVNNEVTDINPDNGFGDSVPTVDGLFQLIQDAINQKVAQLTVSYDAALGYPTNLYIDRDFLMADEEIGYKVEDLVVLKK